jgi:hypothetical protein
MIVTEIKTIKIDRECKTNPVFISWVNNNGGREHWIFEKVQTKALVTQSNGTIEPYNIDIENSRGRIIEVSKDATPLLVCFAFVDIEDVEGLKTLLFSPCVEMLMNIDTVSASVAPIWQTVRPLAGSFKLYNTNQFKTDLEITFELDPLNNISR